MKNKKTFIIILIIILLGVIAFVIWRMAQPKYHEPEILEPEVFEDSSIDKDILVGLWQMGTVYYRYNADGTGCTWDTADDVTEAEAGKFTWELKEKILTHFHQMEIGSAIIPKTYIITQIDLMNMEYEDNFGKQEKFKKVG